MMKIINSNSLKYIEPSKALLNSFQTENHINKNEKKNKNNINKNKIININNQELIFNLEDKENINLQNSNISKNINKNRINDLNAYVFKKNDNNRNSIKIYERIENLDFYKKKINRNFIYSNDYNNNTVYNNQINENNNDNNYEIKNNKFEYIKFKNKNFRNDDGHLTDRFQTSFVNKKIIKPNNYYLFENKPLTEREFHNNNNIYNISPNSTQLLPKNNSGKKTLILDLDETLIHSSFKPFNNIQDDFVLKINSLKLNNKLHNNGNKSYLIHVLKRPFVGVFLSIICDIFEVVVFTASIIDYANPIIDEIDIEKKIKYRLFREHCIKINKDRYIKNLNNLGRDLKNVIIIDNNPLSYSLNLDNGLPISTWETNQNDNELIKIIPLLQYLSKSKIYDVRPIIKRIVKNNVINYDEANKIINYNNKIINFDFISREKETEKKYNKNEVFTISKNKSLKDINPKFYVEKNNQNDFTINKKLKNNDNGKYYKNDSINDNRNSLKEIYLNNGNQMFINKIRNIKLNNNRNNENPKSKSFQGNEDINNSDNNNLNINTHSRNSHLSEKYLNIKKENNNQSDITFNGIIKKNKTRYEQSLLENRKKEINIPIPTSNTKIFYKNNNNLLSKKFLYQKKPNRISLNKNNQSKGLIKNNSDLNCILINNNNLAKEKDPSLKIINILKYPNLKNNLLYHKLFYNNYYNKKEKKNKSPLTKLISRNKKRNIILDNKDKINEEFKNMSFYSKNNNIDFKKDNENNNKAHNYSFEYYLNNRFNLEILDNNFDKFIARLKKDNKNNENDAYKEKDANIENKCLQKNKSFSITTNVYNLIYLNRSLKDIKNDNTGIKHSLTFYKNNSKIKNL